MKFLTTFHRKFVDLFYESKFVDEIFPYIVVLILVLAPLALVLN